ncbi:hypothetical protein C8Q79DRAFT_137735 [Trametes meyenii]|nr:hypothetical protein C8Q79DRAFT_137735 [Trametes meyenii]
MLLFGIHALAVFLVIVAGGSIATTSDLPSADIVVSMTLITRVCTTIVLPNVLTVLQSVEATYHQTPLETWLRTTNAKLTFINPPPSVLDHNHSATPRSALNTIIVYCSKRVGDVCGGECTVYNGSATCLFTPHTQCILASKDIGFCDRKDCDGNCRTFSGCGTFLRDGFCLALGTKSIVVSPL